MVALKNLNLENWAERILMNFNKVRRKALHLERNNLMHQYTLGADRLENILAKKDPGLLVDNKLTMSQQCTLTAKKPKNILGCTRKIIASKSREASLPLCSVLVRHIWSPGPSLEPQYHKDMYIMKQVQQRAIKMIKELVSLTYIERG
ncbi:mitochondrial enolase superfamily member 1 [Grus japonensis]|uniref:Mitochondrial enolase superfamily member 1 n=1 Tax=Grus japonensis TaxID=30415 RepID=A0ABC9WNV6_GRUJA